MKKKKKKLVVTFPLINITTYSPPGWQLRTAEKLMPSVNLQIILLKSQPPLTTGGLGPSLILFQMSKMSFDSFFHSCMCWHIRIYFCSLGHISS